MCCAGRGTSSQREIVLGSGFRSPNQPDQGADRDLPYQFRLARARSRQLCYGRRQPGRAIWGISAERWRGMISGGAPECQPGAQDTMIDDDDLWVATDRKHTRGS